ncbi:MAG: serine hydrolase [Patescibacteria group bacterium]
MPPENLPIAPTTPPPPPLELPAPHPHKLHIEWFLVIACVLAVFGVVYAAKNIYTAPNTSSETNEMGTTTEKVSSFPSVVLEARAGYVWDVKEEKVLFSKNSTLVLPLASVTKLMTALTAFEEMPAETIVTVSYNALQTSGESGLHASEKWGLHELISLMLVTSSNDAATALKETYEIQNASTTFAAALNKTAQGLGLHDTTFVNETGLDIGFEKAGNIGSAQDIARLFEKVMQTMPDILETTQRDEASFVSLEGTKHTVANTNMIANEIPWSLGSKTGFTDAAGGNLVISFDATIGRPIIIVVLGSSREGRFDDAKRLMNAVFAYFGSSS